VWPVAAAVLAAGLLLARHLARLAGDWAGARSRAGRAAALVSAAAVAALAHGALTLSERALARDATYSRIMTSESDRRVERELARLAAQAKGRGAALDSDQLARMRDELERSHRAFPLIPVLAALLALACGVGVWLGVAGRGDRAEEGAGGERGPPSWRGLARLAAITAATLALVAALRLLEAPARDNEASRGATRGELGLVYPPGGVGAGSGIGAGVGSGSGLGSGSGFGIGSGGRSGRG